MRWLASMWITAACFGAGCGPGVSEDPLASGELGGASGRHSNGSAGSSDATGGTDASRSTGGTESNSGGSSGSTTANGGTTALGGTNSDSSGNSTGANSGEGGSEDPGGKPSGDRCSDDDECDSNHCADGVCCNEACDGVCERCDELGTCTFSATDDACSAPYECTDRNRCRLPDGETCDDGGDCESEHCEATDSGATVCCETPCTGTCQTCSADGTCSDYPASDDDCSPRTCEPNTPCVEYRPPAPNACAGHLECAECEPIHARAGLPCGVGRQCDGAGECRITGRGRVAAGESHTCAINDAGNVVCWGDNRFGQLGAVFHLQRVGFDELPLLVPEREIDFEHDVVQITAGAQHTCVLFDTGDVRCWGTMYDHPTFGQIFSIWGTIEVAFVQNSAALLPPYGFIDPLNTGNVILPDKAVQISAAPEGATICALLISGKISCWGLNFFGQLGLGNTSQPILAQLDALPVAEIAEKAVAVRSAFAHTCALMESGRVQCWGDGLYGRLGSGESGPRYSPMGFVEIGEPVIDLAVGFDHTCVLLARGAVRCWGNNHQGQLGYGHTDAIGDDENPAQAAMNPLPENVARGGDVALGIEMTQIVTFPASSTRASTGIWDSSPTCALSKNKLVRCWGRNDLGQLGYGHNQAGATEYTPVELEEIWPGDASSNAFVNTGGEILALSDAGRCALRTSGNLYCWGANDQGQVGLPGDPTPSLSMRPVDFGPVHWW